MLLFGGLKTSRRGSRDGNGGTANNLKCRAVTGLGTDVGHRDFDRKCEVYRNNEDSQLL